MMPCPCPRCRNMPRSSMAIDRSEQTIAYLNLPNRTQLERFCWIPNSSSTACECLTCRRMGLEHGVHIGNVNQHHMTKKNPFIHRGKWIPTYHHIPLYGINWSNTSNCVYYSPETLKNGVNFNIAT